MKMTLARIAAVSCLLVLLTATTRGDISVTQEHLKADDASADVSLERITVPSRNDVATKGQFKVVSGRPDANSGGLVITHILDAVASAKLMEGRFPLEPAEARVRHFHSTRCPSTLWHAVPLGAGSGSRDRG